MASSVTAPPGLSEAATAVVHGLLGHSVGRSECVDRGMMTFKYRVRTLSGDDVMVRFYPAGRASVVDQEPDLLIRCRQAGLPVPELIGDSRTGPSAPLAYVAYRRILGETLADRLPRLQDGQRHRLARGLVGLLRRLEDISLKGAGELLSGEAAHDVAWTAFVGQCMQAGLESVKRHALLPPSLTVVLERVLGKSPPEFTRPTGRLVWGDINFENILVNDEGTVSGLIDFEGCLSGDPLATLGYCKAVHGLNPFFEKLIDVWSAEVETEPDLVGVAWYALLRAMRLARYAHVALPTGRARDPLIRIVPGIVPALLLLDRADQSLLRGVTNDE